jgi:serine O-acetyltransferase
MFDNIRADLQRFIVINNRFEPGRAIRLIWDFPSLKALFVYRLGRWLQRIAKCPLWWPFMILLVPVYFLLVIYVRVAYDIYLELSADIGPGLYIGHFGGIRLRNCRLGEHCSIHQEVRIEPDTGSIDGPKIGNHVWIGPLTEIQGPVQIGNGASIGAGTSVTKDIAAYCLFLGNPGRVIQTSHDNSPYM